MDYKNWLKNKDLEYKDGILHIANVDTIGLAEEYGTPLYVVNEKIIRTRYQSLKNTLDSEYKNNDIHFAVKSNTSLAMLKILKSEGAGFDCSSQGEVYICLKAGIPADSLIYTGNMFTNEDFIYAIENDVLVNLDSISQLKRFAKVYDDLGKEKGIISFRINPEFGAGHHVHTITAGKEIKFGILDTQVIEAYTKAKEFGWTRFGTHMHIGSGIINARDFEKGAEKYLAIIKDLAEKLNITFEMVDFGGGIGIPYKPEDDPFNMELYKEVVLQPFKELVGTGLIGDPILKLEPGRFLSCESTILLSQINTVKYNGFKWFAGLNAGFNTLIRPSFYGSYHHIVVCDDNRDDKKNTYDIAGPICESGDILGREREMPELREGEYIAILDAGAYGYIMSSPYNSRPRAAEVLLKDGKSMLIREKETYDDLLKGQIVPDHLK